MNDNDSSNSNTQSLMRGTCPKCAAQDVRSGGRVRVCRDVTPKQNRQDFFQPAYDCRELKNDPFHLFVCVACGYSEIYVLDSVELRKIATEWPRVES